MSAARRRLGALLAASALLAGSLAVTGATAAAVNGTVFVNTVPATPGIAIDVAGVVQTTGLDGSFSLALSSLADVSSTVALASTTTPAGDSVTLNRVTTGPHVPYESHIFVGLNITSRVRLRVVAGNSGVAPATVHQLTLRAITGQVLRVNPQTKPFVRLLARRAQYSRGVLVAQTINWFVDRIQVAKGVAVTAGRRPFDPLGHSVWKLSLQSMHGKAIISTVPAVAGVVFAIDGASVVTNQRGEATAPVADLNDVVARLRLTSADAAGGLQVSNMRVEKLPPEIVRQRHISVALDVRRPVMLRFVDLRQRTVPTSRITDLTLSTNAGDVRVPGSRLSAPLPMLVNQATRVGSGWQPAPVTYTLRSVLLDGGEAVFNGRQRFQADSGTTWTISLAVFTLTVTAHDAVFGSQLASRMVITRPDGTKLPIELSSARPRITSTLVRGLYSLHVDSAVLAGRASVLVSRDERIDLRVVTLWDALAFLAVVIAIVIGAVLGGRRMARRRSGSLA
ncbi:MAG TPA: hypothetical protein VKB75_07545 [Jatrophihabitans sp.]|nr:hypothetical protein [Jatrophihabitans sp.]